MKVIFFGTPVFAAEILRFLFQEKVDLCAVVTQPDRPKGRSGKPIPSPVKQIAHTLRPDLPVYSPEKASAADSAALLQVHEADLFIVVAYGEIIKENLLNMPKLACINIHASILPKYRGAAPIQHCILEGAKESGVTIMHMAKKMDAGDIIKIAKVPITENMTAGDLEIELCKVSQPELLRVIKNLEQGKCQAIEQNHKEATFAPKLSTTDGFIDWKQDAEKIHNQVRGLNPRPGAWCRVSLKHKIFRLKLHRTLLEKNCVGLPGQIIKFSDAELTVACQNGAVRIIELQLEGKKRSQASQFFSTYVIKDVSFMFN